jgi:hypothetical protein
MKERQTGVVKVVKTLLDKCNAHESEEVISMT